MIICSQCESIEMSGIGNLCRQCQREREELEFGFCDDEDPSYVSRCSECGEEYRFCYCPINE